MKIFIVYTYYQLMHAMAMTLTFDEPVALVFIKSYMKPSELILERIRETGLFCSVIGTDDPGQWKDFYSVLKETEGLTPEEIDRIGSSIFEKYLTPYYEKKLEGVDKESEIYIYNDFQWIYYYVANHFENIVGVEDGYKSLYQQMSCQFLKGNHIYKGPFIEKGYYPQPLYKDPKIKRIISSCDFEELSEYYKERLEVIDFAELVKSNEAEFRSALSYIFQIDKNPVGHSAALVLGQPLEKKYYCDAVELYLLDRKMIRQEQQRCEKVFYKPHPGSTNFDPIILADPNTYILPKEFPIEVLNYSGYQFEHGVTFGSTGLDLCTCVKEKQHVLNCRIDSMEDIKQSIKSYVEGEKLNIQFLLITPVLSLESYVNMLSFVIDHPYISSSVKILVREKIYTSAKKFYSLERKNDVIEKYMDQRVDYKEQLMWIKELTQLKQKNVDSFDIEIVPCKSFSVTELLYNHMRQLDEIDYVMIVDMHNLGFKPVKQIIKRLEKNLTTGISFQTWTSTDNQLDQSTKVYLSSGKIGSYFSDRIINRLWHTNILRELVGCESKYKWIDIINNHRDGMISRVSNPLYINCDELIMIDDGEEYYEQKINSILESSVRKSAENSLKNDESTKKKIALTITDYIDWLCLKKTNGDIVAKHINSLLEKSVLSDSQKIEVMLDLAAGLLEDKNKLYSLTGFKDNDFNQYSKKAVKTLAKRGVLSAVILGKEKNGDGHVKKQRRLRKIKNRIKKTFS